MEILEALVVIFIVIYFIFFRREKQKEIVYTEMSYVYSDYEIELLNKIETYRNEKLITNNYISYQCLAHNTYMIDKKTPSHDYFQQRSDDIIKTIKAINVGEIIAYNYINSYETMKAWLNSPEHKKILDNSIFTHIGISYKESFVTVIFAYVS